ncbi:hypothetical protein DDF62_01675 [Caulobacter radicis]|nr:hypothetical protein DDF62_01675 [Caulobacter radicis]
MKRGVRATALRGWSPFSDLLADGETPHPPTASRRAPPSPYGRGDEEPLTPPSAFPRRSPG